MRIQVNGQRLTSAETAKLIDIMEWRTWSDMLIRQGYILQPLRCPRTASRRGRITLRATWIRRACNDVEIARMTATLAVEPV